MAHSNKFRITETQSNRESDPINFDEVDRLGK